MLIKKPTQDVHALVRDRRIRSIIIFTFGYLSIAIVLATVSHNWEFALYICVVLLLTIFTILVRLYTYISSGILWSISLLGIVHMLGGVMPIPATWPIEKGGEHVLYSLWLIPDMYKFDNLVHGCGFAIVTIMCWQALRGTLANITPRFGVLVLCMLASTGIGSMNEIVEYIATKILPHTNVGGYDNNMWDLIWNALGSFAAAMIIYQTHPFLDSATPHEQMNEMKQERNGAKEFPAFVLSSRHDKSGHCT